MNSAVASPNYQSDDISVSEPASASSDCSGNSEDAKPASIERKLQSSATSMADSARTQATAASSVSGFSPGDSGADKDRAKKATARTTSRRERHPVALKRAPDVASTPTTVDSAPDRAMLDRAAREAAKNTDYSDSDNARVGASTEQSAQEDLEAGAGVMKEEQQSEEEVQSESLSPPAEAASSSVPDEENQEASLPVVDSSASPPIGQPPIEIREPAPSQGSSPPPEESPPPNADPSRELPEAIPVPEPLALRPGTSVATQGSSVAGSHVVQAQPLDTWDEDKEGRSKPSGAQWLSPTQWAVGGLLIVVLIVVGVVVGITQTKDGGGGGGVVVDQADNSTSAPSQEDDAVNIVPETSSPSYATFPPFSSTLHFLTQQALDDPASPQSRANAWMVQDPHLVEYGEDRKLQRFALATLYYSTSGDQWDNNDLWLDYEHDECEWYNQDALTEEPVCTANSTILHLKLSDNSLDGVLPVELFSFPALETLDLSRNRLHGTAPTMFAGARNLKRLVLSSNQLTGQFTAELGFVASQLAVLHNDDNQITGSVPGLLRLLPHLHDLNITGNQYTGSLPRNLNQLRDTLTSLEVSDNAITGAIPTELGAASNLQVLDVGGNPQLGGTIPTELATLANLATLDISNTAISGALPGDLCALQHKGQLELVADCGGTFHCCPV